MFEVRINKLGEGIYYLIVLELDNRRKMWYSGIKLIYRKKLTQLSIKRLIECGRLDIVVNFFDIDLLLKNSIIKYVV